MKESIITLILLVSLFSCKENDNKTNSTEVPMEQTEQKQVEAKVSKFEDTNGCSEYTNLYEALPHLDVYKGADFGELECIYTKEPNPFSIMLNAHYYGKDFSELNAYLFEVTGESAKVELNLINLANATYSTLTVPGSTIFKSSLSQFENGSIVIEEATSSEERTFATYTANYKGKYSIKIQVKLPGRVSLKDIEIYINDYLNAINKIALI